MKWSKHTGKKTMMNRSIVATTLNALLTLFLVMTGSIVFGPPESVQAKNSSTPPPQLTEAGSEGIHQLPPLAPGVVLIGLKAGVTVGTSDRGVQASDASLSAAFANVGVQDIGPVFPSTKGLLSVASINGEVDLSRIYRLRLAPDADILRAVQDLSANPAVEYAEPDYLAHLIATPNDPLYSGQWGLTQINAPAAWDVTTGSTDVVIAVIDAGLDTDHTDLAGQLWTNPGEITGNSVDDDNNGYVDDIHGWNLVDNNANLSDNTGHGTQVAGVIAAATNNSQGVAGVCWNCRLMTVKVTQSGGVANYSDVAAGVVYAAQKGAEVINLSLGGSSDSATLKAAIATASQTAVVVGGTGNDDSSAPFYPAAYDDYVLAVAGTTNSDTKVGTSNYGTWVDVSAPGEDITTTFDGGGYGSTSGTSMAAPFAAGLAGLLRSLHPGWSANQARAQIVQTTDDIDGLNPGYEGKLGSGRIDASQAVATAAQPLLTYQSHKVDGQPNGRPEPGSTVDLDVTLYNDWADATNVQATLSESDPYVTVVNATASYGSIAAYESGTNATSFRFSVSGSAPYAHDISFTLNVTADGGYAVNIPLTIPTSPGITYVHGTLTTQTWTNDRTYIVDNEAGVGAGETLTIEPGTVVRFAGNYSLSVAGTLIADGTASQPIRFTSNHASLAAGDWGQIKFLDSSVDATFDGAGNYTGGSILRHTIIEYGQGVNLNNAAPYIAHNTFAQISGTGIGGSGSAGLVVADNTLTGVGINLSASGGGFSVVRNTVSNATLTASGAGTIAENSVSDASGTGISASGSLTVTANWVVDCSQGMTVNGGFVSGNLVANNDSNGLRINGGTPTVVSNTVVFNGGAGIYIASGTPALHHNNLVASAGQYALRNATANGIDATGNWWGTTGGAAIQATIYDGSDEFGLGMVNYGGYLSGPEQEAPVYLSDVTLIPASPVGIQTVTFDLTFSRPMDQSTDPQVTFSPAVRGMTYNSSNSGLPDNHVRTIAFDDQEHVWFGTSAGGSSFDGQGWTTYDTANSGLAGNSVSDIAFDAQGHAWFCSYNDGVTEWDGTTWTQYRSDNSGLVSDHVESVAVDADNQKWFGTSSSGVSMFDGSNWTSYASSNSGLPDNGVLVIAVDHQDHKWFGTYGGVAEFDGTTWRTYTPENSGLGYPAVRAISIDSQGRKWFGHADGLVSEFDGANWVVHELCDFCLGDNVSGIAEELNGNIWASVFGQGVFVFDGGIWSKLGASDIGLPTNYVYTIAIDSANNKWFGTNAGATLLYAPQEYKVLDNATWTNESHWRATYDVTSLVPRDDYTISVSGARGTDGMEIPTDTRFGFTVDYAGEITDQTPPNTPWVFASGKDGDASYVKAMWSASDPDSAITGYRYAIGSAPGATDIVNWTFVGVTGAADTANATSTGSITRSGLGLVDGQQYWFTVQARNAGGLWSASGYSALIAGQQSYLKIFLPVVLKNQ